VVSQAGHLPLSASFTEGMRMRKIVLAAGALHTPLQSRPLPCWLLVWWCVCLRGAVGASCLEASSETGNVAQKQNRVQSRSRQTHYKHTCVPPPKMATSNW
jgi:hypothetical protein